MPPHADPLAAAAQRLRACRRLVVFTGAGVSQESGVPTFRDALTGLWANDDPLQLASRAGFTADPARVWAWYAARRAGVAAAQPNPGHHALAALETHMDDVVVVTQNVDDLHERAGSTRVLHLHGHLHADHCFDACQDDPTPVAMGAATPPDGALPPRCPHCGAFVRPGVVWFGEALPTDVLAAATRAVAACDAVLIVGASGMVSPANTLPALAARHGAALVEVNPVASAFTPRADVWLAGTGGDVLPRLVAAVARA